MAAENKEIPVSNLQNYIRLQYLLNTTTSGVLRDQFRAKWNDQNKSDWGNLPVNGVKFISGLGQALYKRIGSIQRKLLELGDLQKWDILLLVDALECLDKTSRTKLEPIKKIRNTISHQGSMELENTEFEDMWQTISGILESYGVSQDVLLKIKKTGLEDDQEPKIENHLNEINIARAEELKNNGNDLFRKEKYKPAIFMFTEALKLPGIRSNDIAVLYSNRSIAHLKSGDMEGAKEDAKGAIQLRPSWWKAYHRLASAYNALEKFEKAIRYFNIAHGLEPTNPHIIDDRDHCLHLLEKRKRGEHSDPKYFAESFDEVAYVLEENYGIKVDGEELHQNQRIRSMLQPPHALCGEGHNYRHGRGVKQDFNKAYEYYAKAAEFGIAQGLYNCAELTRDGLGTTRSIAESVRLLELAAKQEPFTVQYGITIPNIGVMEAEHALGLSYQTGVGVLRDAQKAQYWYERAILHSSGCSANNMALMYDNGEGVPRDYAKAVHYWKIGCWLKSVRAIENLANAYLRRSDRNNAQKFYAFGISQGSASLKMEYLTSFKAVLGKDLDKPLNIDVFEQELLEEIFF